MTNPYFAHSWKSQSYIIVIGIPHGAPACLIDPRHLCEAPTHIGMPENSNWMEEVTLQSLEPKQIWAFILDLILVSASKHRPSTSKYPSSTVLLHFPFDPEGEWGNKILPSILTVYVSRCMLQVAGDKGWNPSHGTKRCYQEDLSQGTPYPWFLPHLGEKNSSKRQQIQWKWESKLIYEIHLSKRLKVDTQLIGECLVHIRKLSCKFVYMLEQKAESRHPANLSVLTIGTPGVLYFSQLPGTPPSPPSRPWHLWTATKAFFLS